MGVPKKTTPTGNLLLDSLPRRDFARLQPMLEEVPLDPKKLLYTPNQRIEFAYFPVSGMISMVRRLEDGKLIEVGLVGREGFYGVSLLHGVKRSPIEGMVQGKGTALRIRAPALLAELERNSVLKTRMLLYAEVSHLQTSQTAACNGHHPLDKRLMRWLLEADDRMQPSNISLSHEFLGIMLGIRRAGVTVALGLARKAGLIETGPRTVRVIDRNGVEAAACECYATVKAEANAILD